MSDYELRFAIVTHGSGRVELRYFAHPHDVDGVTIRLTSREAAQFISALETPGFHVIGRDDAPELQLSLSLAA